MPAGTRNPEKWVSTKAALGLRPFAESFVLLFDCMERRGQELYPRAWAKWVCSRSVTVCIPSHVRLFRDPVGCTSPGSSVQGILFLLQGIFLTQGSNLCLLHWQADSLTMSHQGSPYSRGLLYKVGTSKNYGHTERIALCLLLTILYSVLINLQE